MKNACVICDGMEVLALNERRSGVDIVVCESCGLVWNRLMREEQEQEEFYRETNRASPRVSRPYLLTRLLRAACILEFLEGDVKPGLRHLDVGCAEGTLLTLTRAQGLQVTGLELDSWHAPFARKVRGLQVHATTLEAAPLAESSYDLVSFVHVIEHLFHPVGTLKRAHQLLADGGLLYVEVPNLQSASAGAEAILSPPAQLLLHDEHAALACQQGWLCALARGLLAARCLRATAGCQERESGGRKRSSVAR